MNNFANTIFNVLFGWVRALIGNVWNTVVHGELSGFFIWLGDHWLLLLVFLCLCCTVLDYLVWLLRWQPYRVWRTKLRRLFGARRPQEEEAFYKGYEEGVALDMEEEIPPAPVQVPAWIEEREWQPAQQEAQPAAIEETPAPAQETMSHSRRYFPQPESYEPPPVHTPSRLDRAYASDMPAARRRRRSEKYERRKKPWEKLNRVCQDEEAMLDGLPPLLDKEKAFHEPVYPQRDQQLYNAWKRPDNHSNG